MKKERTVTLRSGRTIGGESPCFIVAEVGNNHQGDIAIAREMIEMTAEAGADGVKFQKRNMDALLTREGLAKPYTGPNSFGSTYGEHRNALELSIDQMAELKEFSEKLGLVFFASAWDEPSLDEILALDVELLKVASADLVNLPLLRKYAKSRVPVILSTGMSCLDDVDKAVDVFRDEHEDIVVLHCNSTYPCPEEQIGLPVMDLLRERYRLPIGYSGHERGLGPSVAAAALGACCVERHVTMDKTWRGTDHQVSLEPEELKALVRMIRETEAAMKIRGKIVFAEEESAAKKLRKCIVFSRDLPAGHVICEEDIATRSPRDGLSPVHWDEIIGATLTRAVCHEEPLQWECMDLSDCSRADAASS